MPIRCTCPNGHTLKAPDALAGGESVCPQCGEKVLIPALETQAEATEPAQSTPPPLPANLVAETAVEWRLASPDGQQFGPTVETVFTKWITDGRVQPDWLVWRTGWPEWKTAAEAEDDLPAPLVHKAPEPPVPPAPSPSVPLSDESAEAHLAPAPATGQTNDKQDSGGEYLDRRRKAARRRKQLVILLALAVIVMLGVLAWLVINQPYTLTMPT